MTPNEVKEILGEIYQCEIKVYSAGRLAMFLPVDSFSLPLMYQDEFFQMHRNVQTMKESSDILEIINDYKALKDRIELVDRTFQASLDTQAIYHSPSFILEKILNASVFVDIGPFYFYREIDMWKLFSDIKKVINDQTNYLELCIYEYEDIEIKQEHHHDDGSFSRVDFDCWKVDEYR